MRRLIEFSRSPFVLALVLATMSAVGFAQGAAVRPRGTAPQQADCMADVFRLCPTEIPDEMAILACLQTKSARLSPACHRVIEPDPQTRG